MSIYVALRLLAILTALLLASVEAAHGVEADWIRLGPGGGDVQQIIVAPSDPDMVYASVAGALSRSVDRGASWTRPPGHRAAVTFAVDPSAALTVYAGVASNYGRSNGGVFKSEDGGDSWRQINLGLTDHGFTPTVMAVAVDPHDPNTLYIASSFVGSLTTQVAKSVDAGASWQGLSSGLDALVQSGHGVRAIAIDALDPANVYIVAGGAGVLASDDHGSSWMPRNVGLDDEIVTSLTIAPSDRRRLYVSTGRGALFRSADTGATWSRVAGVLTGAPILSIAVAPRDADHVFVALGDDGLLESRDAGDTWRRVQGLPRDTVQRIAIDPSDGGIYAGMRIDGIFASADGGRTWRAANLGLSEPVTTTVALAPGDREILLAGGLHGVYASSDAGRSWTRTVTPVDASGYSARVVAVVAGTRPSRRIYAATADGQVLTSDDGGAEWDAIGPDVYTDESASLAVDPHDARTLYAAFSSGVYKTSDAGVTWQRASDGLPESGAAEILVDPTRPDTVYLAMHGNGIYRSDDDGASWQLRNHGLNERGGIASAEALAADPRRPGVVYAGTYYGGVFRSEDFGDSWTSIGLSGDFGVLAVAVDPTSSRRLYAATQGRGVWHSQDGGLTWEPLGSGLDDEFIAALAVDQRGRRVYAAAESSVVAIEPRAAAPDSDGGSGCALGEPTASPAPPAVFVLSLLLALWRGRPKRRHGLAVEHPSAPAHPSHATT